MKHTSLTFYYRVERDKNHTLCVRDSIKVILWYEKSLMLELRRSDNQINLTGGVSMDDDKSLSHTRWNCKYHIVFIPKYRRKAIYGKLRTDIGVIIRQLCAYKDVEIIEAHAMPDHIHMLVRIPPKIAVSSFMGYLKGKSSLIIFERHANLKYKYGNRNFWAKGFFVSTVGLDTEKVKQYIRDQEKEDMMQDDLSNKEYVDPFKGS